MSFEDGALHRRSLASTHETLQGVIGRTVRAVRTGNSDSRGLESGEYVALEFEDGSVLQLRAAGSAVPWATFSATFVRARNEP